MASGSARNDSVKGRQEAFRSIRVKNPCLADGADKESRESLWGVPP